MRPKAPACELLYIGLASQCDAALLQLTSLNTMATNVKRLTLGFKGGKSFGQREKEKYGQSRPFKLVFYVLVLL